MTAKQKNQSTEELIRELEEKVSVLTRKLNTSLCVVRVLGTYLHDGGEVSGDLALAIGGCLMDMADENNQCGDKDLQLLLDACDRHVRL